ncbi:prephenate dehydratase [Candidatus Sumerlaeota bacterium]|nr:prephenate dehydratase [Candidatus Sumerlaeota bacterium]
MAKRKSPPRKGAARRPNIASLRREIDAIDTEVIELLNRRAVLAQRVGEAKSVRGQAMFDPARQRQILRRLAKRNPGPYPTLSLQRVWTEIMGACLSLEQPLRVGYLGPESSFSHLAAIHEFGHAMDLRPYVSISDIFHAVEKEHLDCGVVPIENSTEGIVHFTMDSFLDSPLKICSELLLRIRLSLLAKGTLGKIKRVYSHPQPFRQCHRWLRENLPQAKLVEVSSTAKGSELAARTSDAASIGSVVAAEKYGLKIIAEGIEDDADNTTRFLVISPMHPGPSGDDKTSIMFTLRDKPGALVSVLEPLDRKGINMTNIDVRPSRRRAFDYVFFIDLEGHIEERRVADAIEQMHDHCVMVKVLGSYPRQAVRTG